LDALCIGPMMRDGTDTEEIKSTFQISYEDIFLAHFFRCNAVIFARLSSGAGSRTRQNYECTLTFVSIYVIMSQLLFLLQIEELSFRSKNNVTLWTSEVYAVLQMIP